MCQQSKTAAIGDSMERLETCVDSCVSEICDRFFAAAVALTKKGSSGAEESSSNFESRPGGGGSDETHHQAIKELARTEALQLIKLSQPAILKLVQNSDGDGGDHALKSCGDEYWQSILNNCSAELVLEIFDDKMLTFISNNGQYFDKKLIKTKTKYFFKQDKFNLLREECQGFGYLIAMILLSQIMDSAEYESTFSQFHDSLVQCIGIFNLDPIRVLELLLIVYKFSYGSHSQNLLLFRKNLLKFIAASGLKIHLISLITMRSGSDRILSQEDYRVLLDLCADKIVDFTDVSTIVSPQTKLSVSTSFSAYLKCLNGALKSLNVISLKKDDDGTGLKYSEAAKSHYELVQASGEFKLCLSGCDPLYQDFDKYSKFMLHIVFKSPRFAYTCCSMELINSLATHIVNRLKSLKVQDNCCGNSTLLWHESIFELHRYFYCIGPYFIYAPIQFCYLLNYLQDVFDARMASNDFYNVESLRVVEFLFIEILIPAVSLCDSNIFILNNFWRLFRWLDFKRRFKIYSLIDKYLYSSCEALMEVKYTSLVAIRGLLKRLSNDNIKEFSAMIVKLALTSPLIVFKEIFDQIQSYENIINPIVECLSSLIGYSYDILSYLFVAFIDRVKSDVKFESNIFLDPKIQNMITFFALCCQKFTFELQPLVLLCLKVLTSRHNKNNSSSASSLLGHNLLKTLMQSMIGIEPADHANVSQTYALTCLNCTTKQAAFYQKLGTLATGGGDSSQRFIDAFLSPLRLAQFFEILLSSYQNAQFSFEEYSIDDLSSVDFTLNSVDLHKSVIYQLIVTYQVFHSHLSANGATAALEDCLVSMCRYSFEFVMSICQINLAQLLINSIRDLHSVNSEEISSPQSLEKTRSLIDEHLNLAVEKYQNVLPRAIHSFSNKDFLTFWLFSPVLLVSNQEIYSQVLKNLDAEKAQLESINGLKNTQALVQEERAIHAAIILHTNHYIVKQNRKIVESEPEAPNDINTFFLLNCLLPRMKVSAVDELMCEKYVEKFVIKKQPRSFLNFLVILDRFIDHLHAQICSSTERECTFIGRFLNFCLRYVNMWHSDAKKYEEAAGNNASIQCLILPQIRSVDFLVAPLNHDQLTNNDEKIVHESLTMTHQMFKEYTQAIHKKLTIIIIAILQHSHSAGALSSPPTPNASNSHAIILRNLVTVLQNAVEQFPMWQKHAHHVQIEVLEINKNFSVPKRGRKDIATLTSSYLVNLGNTSSRWFKKEAGKAVPERRNPSSSSPSSSSADQKNPKKALEAQSSSTNSHNSLKHQTEIGNSPKPKTSKSSQNSSSGSKQSQVESTRGSSLSLQSANEKSVASRTHSKSREKASASVSPTSSLGQNKKTTTTRQSVSKSSSSREDKDASKTTTTNPKSSKISPNVK